MRELPFSWSITIRTVVLSLLLGGASGVLATALTANFLSDYAIELGEYTQPLRLSEQRPTTYPETYAEAIDLVTEEVVPGVVTFFEPSWQTPTRYSLDDALMQGVVLTADGWILAFDLPGVSESALVVAVQGKIYEVEKVVKDVVSDAIFVKVSAEHLPVLAFGQGWKVKLGELVFMIPSQDQLYSTSIAGFDWGNTLLHSSEELSRRIILQDVFDEIVRGAPVANLAGELIGLVESNGKDGRLRVLPLEGILPSFTSLLENAEILRASLGAEVIDLAHTLGLTEEMTRGFTHGSLLYGYQAVEQGSAADKAGLLEGDILLSVDGQTINTSQTLDEYLSQYRFGSEVTFLIDREGEEIEVKVILGE
ncbi:hypothetical protein A2332_01115 [Candidatus Uhrbacteria bacterium RIFOXYB2_FULL_41_18]|nr:MAG: Protease Do [Candidatus Uhrbacteria bacterium GW2011_GWF2_40_263]OGL97303.1 MAG: hypothetical protein A2332_01115 [Candidatus Uhrbacteria bacterium RIFOXYB2_FULL_41_18]